ncbi:hypothetical protein D3C86_1728720 [compost metagenome]
MREHVRLHVVDLDQRYVQSERHRFGERGTHQQSTQQTRSLGKSNGIQVFFCYFCVIQCFVHHRQNVLLMRPRGELGNDAAVLGMDELRSNNIGADIPVCYNSCGGFVARRFNCEDIHTVENIRKIKH